MDEADEWIAEYVSTGVLEVYVEDDEVNFKLGPNAQELAPEFYEEWIKEVNEDLMELFKKDLINIVYDENLEARFEITDEGKEALGIED